MSPKANLSRRPHFGSPSMIAGVPVLSSTDVERVLIKMGFVRRAGKGAHRFFSHDDGRTTTVPFHSGRDISPTLLRKICRDIGTSLADFLAHR